MKKLKEQHHIIVDENGYIELNKVELLWKKREYYNSTNHNDSIYILPNFMEATIETTNIDEK